MLKPVEPILEYCFNYNYIVETLCVNKDKPSLNCNGKCYLIKQLKSNKSDSKKTNTTQQIQLENYPIGFIEITAIKNPIISITKTRSFYNYLNNYSFLKKNIPFHPPKAS
ncbi:hypothetical protein [Mesonia phycicola]|nr:hypothetical protein [Mesonia phycicola]